MENTRQWSRHKEERATRMKADSADRLKIREALSTCIDVFDSETHRHDSLINIFSGQIVDDKSVNADESVKIGTEQWSEYEKHWPQGFHCKISKKVKSMSVIVKQRMKSGPGTHENVNTELIYGRVIGIMASSRETISTKTLFSYELARFPSSLFDSNGDMRTTSKSVLKSKIKVECSQRNLGPCDVVILDACAVLWTVPWPASPAKVSDFVIAAVFSIMRHLYSTKVLHVVFDRYNDNSIKSCCHMQRAKGTSRVYKLSLDCPLPK